MRTEDVQGGAFCDVCKVAVDAVDKFMLENHTLQDITDELVKICDLLPSSDKPLCTTFVDQYTPAIINWLVDNELTQTKVCDDALHLCSNTPASYHLHKERAGDSALCEICEVRLSSSCPPPIEDTLNRFAWRPSLVQPLEEAVH